MTEKKEQRKKKKWLADGFETILLAIVLFMDSR